MEVRSPIYQFIFLSFLIFLADKLVTASSSENKIEDGPKLVDEAGTQTTFILFGSMGDLSKRYLWPGLHKLASSNKELNDKIYLRIYATGRASADKGKDNLKDIFATKLCSAEKDPQHIENCNQSVLEFSSLCSYHRTKSENDYELFSDEIQDELRENQVKEKTRIFYLSVPPFAYSSIVKFIDKYLRPEKLVNIRLVLEKPFGEDQASAIKLGKEILEYFKEEEIYRVDHYLGKQTVDEILKFRTRNHGNLDAVWNNQFIESFEIVMKESNDCKGRTRFYDKYGVVLDVMQNHLTEILARLLMEVPDRPMTGNEFDLHKLETLKLISSPNSDMIIAGQYAGYQKHVMEDMNLSAMNHCLTPTYAAVTFFTNQTKFQNVPIFIISGKKLSEKSTYIKVNFKTSHLFHLFDSKDLGTENAQSYLKFHIHSPKYGGPLIEVHQGLDALKLQFSSLWTKIQSVDGTSVFKPRTVADAYAFLIDKIYDGDRSYFTEFNSLIESWRIWDPVQLSIKSGKVPLMEYDSENNQNLAFKYNPIKMNLNWEIGGMLETSNVFPVTEHFQFSSLSQETFLNGRLVKGELESLIKNLVSTVIKNARQAADNKKPYHLALPGGSSIVPFFTEICKQKNSISLPYFHIWLVDERCVPFNDTKSNFKLMTDQLLNCINIPYTNIHPLPVGFGELLCQDENLQNFNEELKFWIPSKSFDMVILGLGTDGHVASLFPGDRKSLHSENDLVINDSGPIENISRRISMTFKLINSASRISIIATGKKKSQIIELLKRAENSSGNFPVLMIKGDYEKVTWFIDNEAFGGD